MEYDLYTHLKDREGKEITPGFYIEIRKRPYETLEKLCVVYPHHDRFLAYFLDGERKSVVCSDVWVEETEVGSMVLKKVEITTRVREAIDLLDFVNTGLQKIPISPSQNPSAP